jgi:hypothetical protein
MAALAQDVAQLILEFEAGMIRADGDSHGETQF